MTRLPLNLTGRPASEIFAAIDAAKVSTQAAVIAAGQKYADVLFRLDAQAIVAPHLAPSWSEIMTARAAADAAREALVALGLARAAMLNAMGVQ